MIMVPGLNFDIDNFGQSLHRLSCRAQYYSEAAHLGVPVGVLPELAGRPPLPELPGGALAVTRRDVELAWQHTKIFNLDIIRF